MLPTPPSCRKKWRTLKFSRQPRKIARSEPRGSTPLARSDPKFMFEPYPKYQKTIFLLFCETASDSGSRMVTHAGH